MLIDGGSFHRDQQMIPLAGECATKKADCRFGAIRNLPDMMLAV
jgi:hypothetical protein